MTIRNIFFDTNILTTCPNAYPKMRDLCATIVEMLGNTFA